MNRNNYLEIFYTGICENYKYISHFIEREQKKVESKFVEGNEFLGRLGEAVEAVKIEYNNRLGLNMEKYYQLLNLNDAPKPIIYNATSREGLRLYGQITEIKKMSFSIRFIDFLY